MCRFRPSLPCLLVIACLLAGCSRVPVPRLPGLSKAAPAATAVDQTTTPRDLLGARLVNPRIDADTPSMTVGKLIEFADRYLACDCANTRFVQSWAKTPEGYRLTTNSANVRPLEFVCRGSEDARECFLTEIDRGPQTPDFTERFVPGSEFIRFLYANGVRCARDTPCP